MALNKKPTNFLLRSDTLLDVVKFDLDFNFIGKKQMKLSDWQNFKKQSGFYYRAYEVGFCSFK